MTTSPVARPASLANEKLFSPMTWLWAEEADSVASVGVPWVMLVFWVPSPPVLVEVCDVWRTRATCVNAIIASGLTGIG